MGQPGHRARKVYKDRSARLGRRALKGRKALSDQRGQLGPRAWRARRATREIPVPRVRRVFPEQRGLPVHKAPLARKVRKALPARLEQRDHKGLLDQLAQLGRKV